MACVYIALLVGVVFALMYLVLKIFKKKNEAGEEVYFKKFQFMLKIMAISNKTMKEILALFDRDPESDNAVEKAQKVFEAVYNALKDLENWYMLYMKNENISAEDQFNLAFEKAYSFVKEQLKKIYKDEPISEEIESLVKFLLENGIKIFFGKKNTQ